MNENVVGTNFQSNSEEPSRKFDAKRNQTSRVNIRCTRDENQINLGARKLSVLPR